MFEDGKGVDWKVAKLITKQCQIKTAHHSLGVDGELLWREAWHVWTISTHLTLLSPV